MVVWLRHADVDVGVIDGVVPREAFEQFASLADAAQRLETMRAQRLAQAEDAARRLLDEARLQADALAERAREQEQAARVRGHEAGMRQALDEWHAAAARGRALAARSHAALRERLAAMVVEAVRQLVLAEPGESFFAAALARLDKLAEDAARLTLRLHPADRAAAERALAAAPQPWLAGLAVALEDDASLAPGSCRCESSTGWLDASLEVQLEAVGRVAARSLDAPVRALAPDEEAGP